MQCCATGLLALSAAAPRSLSSASHEQFGRYPTQARRVFTPTIPLSNDAPALNKSFTLVSAQSLSGSFATIDDPAGEPFTYTSTTGKIKPTSDPSHASAVTVWSRRLE
jgi:hypothetical protein